MIRKPARPTSILIFALAAALALATPPAGAAPPHNETPAQANAFLDHFIGVWDGVGSFDGTPVLETYEIERVLGDNFLLIKDTEKPGGAGFEADIYIGYDVVDKRYELHVFTNFTGFGASLPSREMTGQRRGNTLVLDEKPGHGSLRYVFQFQDDDRFSLTKVFVSGNKLDVILLERFERRP